jgi:hypothetical protein
MNKRLYFSVLTIVMAVILQAGLMAQEKTEVTIQVKQDGKVIQDTTYRFNDAEDASQVMKMLGAMLGDEEHMGHGDYNYSATMSEDIQPGKMVFVSKDGDKTVVKKISGDSLVWVSEGESDDDPLKVIKYRVKGDGDSGGEHVIVLKSEDGNSFDILLDEDVDSGDKDVEKEFNVVISGDEDGEWKVIKSDDDDESEAVEVQVKVVKKIKKEEEK